MSFITDIRTYFDTKILECDPNLEFLDDIFGDNDIGSSYPDKFYKLIFGEITPSVIGDFYQDQFPVIVEIYAARSADITAAFDILYVSAVDIKNNLINPISSKNESSFNELVAESILPSPLESDDKTIKMIITFTITRGFIFN